jgi:hypothetical protein
MDATAKPLPDKAEFCPAGAERAFPRAGSGLIAIMFEPFVGTAF